MWVSDHRNIAAQVEQVNSRRTRGKSSWVWWVAVNPQEDECDQLICWHADTENAAKAAAEEIIWKELHGHSRIALLRRSQQGTIAANRFAASP